MDRERAAKADAIEREGEILSEPDFYLACLEFDATLQPYACYITRRVFTGLMRPVQVVRVEPRFRVPGFHRQAELEEYVVLAAQRPLSAMRIRELGSKLVDVYLPMSQRCLTHVLLQSQDYARYSAGTVFASFEEAQGVFEQVKRSCSA